MSESALPPTQFSFLLLLAYAWRRQCKTQKALVETLDDRCDVATLERALVVLRQVEGSVEDASAKLRRAFD